MAPGFIVAISCLVAAVLVNLLEHYQNNDVSQPTTSDNAWNLLCAGLGIYLFVTPFLGQLTATHFMIAFFISIFGALLFHIRATRAVGSVLVIYPAGLMAQVLAGIGEAQAMASTGSDLAETIAIMVVVNVVGVLFFCMLHHDRKQEGPSPALRVSAPVRNAPPVRRSSESGELVELARLYAAGSLDEQEFRSACERIKQK